VDLFGPPALWVCYCGQVAPHSSVFPHRDCDGGRPLRPEEMAATREAGGRDEQEAEVRAIAPHR
jgi:hypothetical protein